MCRKIQRPGHLQMIGLSSGPPRLIDLLQTLFVSHYLQIEAFKYTYTSQLYVNLHKMTNVGVTDCKFDLQWQGVPDKSKNF